MHQTAISEYISVLLVLYFSPSLTLRISQLSCCYDTVPITHSLEEDRFNLVRSFRRLSPWMAGSKAGASWWVSVARRAA